MNNKDILNNERLQKLSKQIISSNNIKRKEKILVLPHNTLRIVDVIAQMEIERIKNPNWNESFQDLLFKMLTRAEKDLGKYNNVDSDVVNKIIDKKWSEYYEIAPRTILYGLIEMLYNQSFVTDIIALFHKKDAWDDALTCDYYDGSIEELERYINDKGITCIFMDDVELLMKLINRKNVDLNWKTIFISKLGYNYMHSVYGDLIMKHSLEFCNEYCLEVGSLTLIEFDNEFYKNRVGGNIK